ncbi:putative hydro-lyase [Nguyenibacter vanlangensis]|uniref:Putative hydro-lyase AAC691_01635 n=2 Tax=Nguyenibacter TaxID=1519186 RepID=A0ABZ3D6B9_9PROT
MHDYEGMQAMAQSGPVTLPYFDASPAEVRRLCRTGQVTDVTAGMATGYIQANIVMLPAALADAFHEFCLKNPKSCPLVGMSRPGESGIPALGADLDLRTDLPRYRIWRNGVLTAEVSDLGDYWQDDLVTFALGCSFSFENVLTACGIPMRHLQTGKGVSMYRTNIACTPVGPFSGPVVVSMRPFRSQDIIKAVEISSAIPLAHGAPVHIGFPAEIGIADVNVPDYGDVTPVAENELPVFWACGVTPQAVLAASMPEFAITHAPGAMLVTDMPIAHYQELVERHRGGVI